MRGALLIALAFAIVWLVAHALDAQRWRALPYLGVLETHPRSSEYLRQV